ncbi:hypothetical protein BDV06DRAFT_227326 [Aspergillus oleicola]
MTEAQSMLSNSSNCLKKAQYPPSLGSQQIQQRGHQRQRNPYSTAIDNGKTTVSNNVPEPYSVLPGELAAPSQTITNSTVTDLDLVPAEQDLTDLAPRNPVFLAFRWVIQHIVVQNELNTKCRAIPGPIRLVNLASTQIHDCSKAHLCNMITGKVNGWPCKYYATGRNCDTTAGAWKIAGATWEDLGESMTKCFPEKVSCIRLDHGGTWRGWLWVGLTKGFDDTARCEKKMNFDECTWGNEDYLQDEE